MKFLRELLKTIIWGGLLLTVFPILVWLLFRVVYSERIVSADDAHDEYPVAIVFGAGLHWDGSPTPVLRDRVKAAVELYNQGKVQKLLLSGDNSYIEYNEPGAMQDYAIELGVPIEDIVLDYAGRRTYDTCYRAKSIFKVEKALLVTQKFHLPRALFLCDQLGISSQGVNADLREYSQYSLRYWNIREIFATISAVWDVWIQRPVPVLGDELPIF
ncbi:MAG: ElyC/SanA/YdcF family protein [Anaerolineaceae bacterium]|nr:ElyC/SanA/YdcF family protein [Anaerolineaceae bacterium]